MKLVPSIEIPDELIRALALLAAAMLTPEQSYNYAVHQAKIYENYIRTGE